MWRLGGRHPQGPGSQACNWPAPPADTTRDALLIGHPNSMNTGINAAGRTQRRTAPKSDFRACFILRLSGLAWSPRQGSRPSGKRGTRLGSDLDADNVTPSSR
jgi:hypothetical protein